MQRVSLAAVWILLPAPALFGQPASSPLSFEVASVKPASAAIATKDEYSAGYNAGMRAALAAQGLRVRGRSVNVTDNSLRDLIRMAYQVKDYQISAPGWIAQEKYQIAATMPAGATRADVPEMLRTLLEQRFHLKLHRETRKMAVYALVEAKGGAKLTAAPADRRAGPGFAREGQVQALSCSLDAFADLLTKAEDRVVVDTTGITGLYDFDLNYQPETASTAEDTRPTLAAVLRERGLRLERRELPAEVLVIDQADKVPTEN